MPLSIKLRVLLAATVLQLVLASSYELAVQGAPRVPSTAERKGVTRPGADRQPASTPPEAPPAATSEVLPCPARFASYHRTPLIGRP